MAEACFYRCATCGNRCNPKEQTIFTGLRGSSVEFAIPDPPVEDLRDFLRDLLLTNLSYRPNVYRRPAGEAVDCDTDRFESILYEAAEDLPVRINELDPASIPRVTPYSQGRVIQGRSVSKKVWYHRSRRPVKAYLMYTSTGMNDPSRDIYIIITIHPSPDGHGLEVIYHQDQLDNKMVMPFLRLAETGAVPELDND